MNVNHDRDLLDALARISPSNWQGIVYRHMFAKYPPERENIGGARWNPPEVPAIYTSLSREAVLAEADYQISMEPLRPTVRRTVYQLEVTLSSVLDLSSPALLQSLGLPPTDVSGIDHASCQRIGGAVEHLGHDGLLVPSARVIKGVNLVIYPNKQTAEYSFRTVAADVIYEPLMAARLSHRMTPP
jgi:RES domain-containing protein